MPKGVPLTKKEKQYILDNCKLLMVAEIAKGIGRSPQGVRRYLRSEGLEQSKELQKECRNRAEINRTTLTPEQDKVIQDNYLNIAVKTLANKIGRSATIVETRLRQLGLVIPPEIIAQRKIDSQRKEGDIPPNKGKKMTPEQYKKAAPTFFKKGDKPVNTIEIIGTITTRINRKRKIKTKYILVAFNTWKELKHYNWEQVNGPVPEGYVLRFKDGNSLNCEIENIEMILREDHMRLNSIHNLPPDLKELSYLTGAVNRQINKHLKS